ncbi:MAG: hypothetical protein U0570_02625 [Phycisphaerales bacterium]
MNLRTGAVLAACAAGLLARGDIRVSPDRSAVWVEGDPAFAERPKLSVRDKQPERTLRIGDPAPALAIEEWSGTWNGIEPGKATVIVFVPGGNAKLAALMGAISNLADRFADRPVRVAAVTGADSKISKAGWKSFLEQNKSSVRVPCGWDDGIKSRSLYLAATGDQQPAMVYVIDMNGRLAWYGPPGSTTDVLNPVLDGTWDLAQARTEIEASDDLAWIQIELVRAQRAKDFTKFEDAGSRLVRRFDGIYSPEFSEVLRDDLLEFASNILNPEERFNVTVHPELKPLALEAAQRAARAARLENMRVLAVLARAQFVNGDRAGAVKNAARALELGKDMIPQDPEFIERVERELASYGRP